MTYQFVSDLHIEYRNFRDLPTTAFVTPGADILILAGDIGSLYHYPQLVAFLRALSKQFVYILYVAGNHEFYELANEPVLSFDELRERLHRLEDFIPNLYILDRRIVYIGGLFFAGCTLWSNPDMARIPPRIVRIREFYDRQVYAQQYHEDVRFLNRAYRFMADIGHPCVVITHHCPSYFLIHNSPLRFSKFRSLYTSDLDHLLQDAAVFHSWVTGHLHINFNTELPGLDGTGTRLVGNQRGKSEHTSPLYRMTCPLALPPVAREIIKSLNDRDSPVPKPSTVACAGEPDP
jgi:hypothetical protein